MKPAATPALSAAPAQQANIVDDDGDEWVNQIPFHERPGSKEVQVPRYKSKIFLHDHFYGNFLFCVGS